MTTKTQWREAAYRAAAAHYGEKYAPWYRLRLFGPGPLGVLVLVGAVAGGLYWLTKTVRVHAGSGPAGLPSAFWAFVVLLALGTAWAFRPRRHIVPAFLMLVRLMIVALLWLGVATYAVTVLI